MKAAWTTARLADVCHIVGGATPSKKNLKFYGGTIPWATVGDMNVEVINETEESITKAAVEDCSTNVVPAGSIVMATRVGLGKVCVLGQDTAINQDLKGLTPKNPKELFGRWLFWWLKSKASDIQKAGTGATVQGVKMTFVQELEIPLPPLAEQKRIVALLDKAFAGIDKAKANAECLLASASHLFSSVLEREFLPAGGSCSRFKISDIGSVYDGPHATPKTIESGPVFLGISALKDGDVDLTETRHVSQVDFKRWTKRVQPKSGDVVFSYETRIGQVAVIPDFLECCLGRRMGLVRLDVSRVYPRFFTYQYLSPPFQRFLHSKTVKGVTVDRLSLKEFPSFEMWIPELTQQQRIVQKVDHARHVISVLLASVNKKLSSIRELKMALLSHAFSGAL